MNDSSEKSGTLPICNLQKYLRKRGWKSHLFMPSNIAEHKQPKEILNFQNSSSYQNEILDEIDVL